MVQFMKPEPASADQRVPSQSNTAMVGESACTALWNSAVVRVGTESTSVTGGPLVAAK